MSYGASSFWFLCFKNIWSSEIQGQMSKQPNRKIIEWRSSFYFLLFSSAIGIVRGWKSANCSVLSRSNLEKMVKRLLRPAYLMRKKNGGGFEMYKKTWEHVCFCFVTLDLFLNFSVPQFYLILKMDLIKMEKKKDLLNRVIKRLKGIIHEKCLVSTWGGTQWIWALLLFFCTWS